MASSGYADLYFASNETTKFGTAYFSDSIESYLQIKEILKPYIVFLF